MGSAASGEEEIEQRKRAEQARDSEDEGGRAGFGASQSAGYGIGNGVRLGGGLGGGIGGGIGGAGEETERER